LYSTQQANDANRNVCEGEEHRGQQATDKTEMSVRAKSTGVNKQHTKQKHTLRLDRAWTAADVSPRTMTLIAATPLPHNTFTCASPELVTRERRILGSNSNLKLLLPGPNRQVVLVLND